MLPSKHIIFVFACHFLIACGESRPKEDRPEIKSIRKHTHCNTQNKMSKAFALEDAVNKYILLTPSTLRSGKYTSMINDFEDSVYTGTTTYNANKTELLSIDNWYHVSDSKRYLHESSIMVSGDTYQVEHEVPGLIPSSADKRFISESGIVLGITEKQLVDLKGLPKATYNCNHNALQFIVYEYVLRDVVSIIPEFKEINTYVALFHFRLGHLYKYEFIFTWDYKSYDYP